ncbi:MAG: oligopeptidase [Actinomycetota bacterium]|nr:oligopeptidase [Actinomycetota bacterium]
MSSNQPSSNQPSSNQPNEALSPPRAPRSRHILRAHGEERVDDWYWLRERDNPDVRAYLEAENAFTDEIMRPTEDLQSRIYDEIASRVQQTDTSAPVPDGPFEYYHRTEEGRQYAIYCRRPRGGGSEQVVLDLNLLAQEHSYLEVGDLEVDETHAIAAYTVDTTGGERYELRFRDLGRGVDLDDVVPDVYYGLAWADDSRTIFYLRPDAAMRPDSVWRHTLGTPAHDDVLVFRDNDERFDIVLSRARSGRYVLIHSVSRTTSEAWFVPTATPENDARVVAARREGVDYLVSHWTDGADDRFYIVTNADGAVNFKLVTAPVAEPGAERWTDVIAHREHVRIERVDAFAGHLVVSERADGGQRLRVRRVSDGAEHLIEQPEEAASVWLGSNPEFDTTSIRYGYSSLVTPTTDYDYEVETRERTLVKRQPVPGFDPEQYVSRRLWAKASDGTEIPISVAHRHDLDLDGDVPVLLYGYGAYEASIDPTFRVTRLPLLDRGALFAIAHVRGGGEMGRPWYENGKLEHKANTFSDFIACAEFLVETNVTTPKRIVARGRSAGGLLMGAITNLRPDLFAAVVAEVPFVDVVTTMEDNTIPLTVGEWEEWGNPANESHYRAMLAYSPYDNVDAKAYPDLLVTAGFNDPRVQYWEPAKWVAKLRDTATSGQILLHTDLGSGHGGPSGRYDAWHEEAFTLAFVISKLGLAG